MIDRLQVVALVVCTVLLLSVFELVRRRKLTEEYSFLWILSSLALLVLSIRREILRTAAGWLGASDSLTVLIMLLLAIVVVTSLCFSVIISRQRQQIERLIEETAILSAELREVRTERARTEEDRWETWEPQDLDLPYYPAPKRPPR